MKTVTEEIKNKLRVIIVDDEREACKNLHNILSRYVEDVEILGIAHHTRDAEKLIDELHPNAIFLDINMPNENAFQFLERVNHDGFEIVFVTAYDEFAIRALKLNAVDYILKPISQDEVELALQRLAVRIKDKTFTRDILSYADLLTDKLNKLVPHKITFKDNNATEVVDFDDLYYIEAKGSYSLVVFHKNNADKSLLVSHPIAEYEDILPEDVFYRIHKSYLVNCRHIHKVIKEDYSVSVADKYILPVSRRRYADMISFIKSGTFNKNQFAPK